ncbi:hypothetical protein ACEPAG_2854 [Sanghuangporus baumii]
MHELNISVPKLHALKLLSVQAWGGEKESLDWEEAPPLPLQTIVLDLRNLEGDNEENLVWLQLEFLVFVFREDTFSSSWPLAPSQSERLFSRCCLHGIKNLRLCILSGGTRDTHPYIGLISAATGLVSLELFIMLRGYEEHQFDLEKLVLSTSLEKLSIHFYEDELKARVLVPSVVAMKFLWDLKAHFDKLSRFRRLAIYGSRTKYSLNTYKFDADGLIRYMSVGAKPLSEGIPNDLFALCNEHGVDVALISNVMPR